MKKINPLTAASILIRNPNGGMVFFAEKILGLPVSKHDGQVSWLTNSKRLINILRPGNRFGKTLIGAVKHLYHAFTKYNLYGTYYTVEEWERINYNTLNFGPAYEQAREMLKTAKDIVEGNIHIPLEFQKEYGVTNKSLLKEWFIVDDHSESQALPFLKFVNGAQFLGRSYADMGSAFKTKGIVYISGDECGDIGEIWTFTNGTLLPRLAQYRGGQIDYYGTVQAEGHDYMRMIDMAEEDMQKSDWYHSGMFYVQKGAMYENPFLDKKTVQSIEDISDPVLKKQTIYGEHVQTGDKYFGYERIQNAVDKKLQLQEKGLPGRRYLELCDFAGGESYWADYTVIKVIDVTTEPYRIIYFNRFKGGDMPIPLQYKLVEDVFIKFSTDGCTAKLIIDSSALGGRNALAFLKHLNPIQYNISPVLKSEMLATLKIAFDGGQNDEMRRKKKVLSSGDVIEENPEWGLIRMPDVPELVNEFFNYKLDDKKIRNDCVMTLAMGVHYQELRRPKKVKKSVLPFDVLAM